MTKKLLLFISIKPIYFYNQIQTEQVLLKEIIFQGLINQMTLDTA
jgi:hypothetical protein